MDRRGAEIGGKPSFTITLSDLLGYVVPGGTLWLCALFFELRASAAGTNVQLATPALNTFRLLYPDLTSPNLVVALALALALLVGFYVTGHVVASFSSLVIDRILVFKGYGYPYEILLRLEDDGYTPFSEPTGWFVRGAFAWSLFYLVCRYLEYAFLYLHRPSSSLKFDLAADWISAAFLIAILIQVSLGILKYVWVQQEEDQFRISKGYKRRALPMTPRFEADIRRDAEYKASLRALPTWAVALCWVLRRLWAAPYDLVAPLLADPLNTRRAFNTAFIGKYRDLFYKRFGLLSEDAATNNFWLSYCHVAERSPRLAASVHNWLNLYGFSRNLAAAFFLAFLYTIIWLTVHAGIANQWPSYLGISWPMTGLAFLAMGLILLLRYYFLYVCYFSKFVFRAFVYVELTSSMDDPPLTP